VSNEFSTKKAPRPTTLAARRFAYVTAIIFSGAMLTRIVVIVGSMAGLCVVAASNRCFSISRDALPAISLAVKLWLLPALTVAVLVAIISQIQGFVLWWNVLIAAPISMLVPLLPAMVSVDVHHEEASNWILAGGAVLFVGVQLSRLVNALIGKLAI